MSEEVVVEERGAFMSKGGRHVGEVVNDRLLI